MLIPFTLVSGGRKNDNLASVICNLLFKGFISELSYRDDWS